MSLKSWPGSGYAPVEAALEILASALRDVKGRMRRLFAQERTAANAGLFLDSLLSGEPRETGWNRAEVAGDAGPWRQQELLGRDRWAADALRDLVCEYVVEHLRDDDAVLVIDETGFLKQGKKSCGVARQYTGSAGKITSCQIGVFPRRELLVNIACQKGVTRSIHVLVNPAGRPPLQQSKSQCRGLGLCPEAAAAERTRGCLTGAMAAPITRISKLAAHHNPSAALSVLPLHGQRKTGAIGIHCFCS